MDEVKEFIVIEEEEGDRLDVYLSEQLEICLEVIYKNNKR